MDDQLKQRLLGATILVALAVIFVPMLFDEKDADRGSVTATNVPPLPPEAQEREIALPAMSDEEKPEGEGGTGVETPERAGYRIIPLDDAPNAAQKPRNAPEGEPPDRGKRVENMPAEFGADEGGEPDELPTRDSPLAKATRSPATKPASPPSKGEDRTSHAPTVPVQDRRKAEPVSPAQAAGARSTSTPKATAAKPQPQKEVASAPAARTEAIAAGQPKPKPAASPNTPIPVERLPPTGKAPAKSAEKSATPPKQTEERLADINKSAPRSSPKPSGAAGEQRTGAEISAAAAAKSATAGKTSSSAPSDSRSSSEAAKPITAHQAPETRADSRPVSGSTKPAQPAVDKAAAPKIAPIKASEPAGQKAPDRATDVPSKKKPDAPATTLASASSTSSGAAAKSGLTGSPKPSAVSKGAEPASKPKSSGGPSAWVIRAGSFTSESGAKALAEKLKKQKFAAYVQKVSGENGAIYRVQVGPELEKGRAEQTRKRLESSAGIRGVLVSHR